MQSPNINKIANNYVKNQDLNIENTPYLINAAQKNKTLNAKISKDKLRPSNKSIIKPAILNQPKIKQIKQRKREIRDKRRRAMDTESSNEMLTSEEEIGDYVPRYSPRRWRN